MRKPRVLVNVERAEDAVALFPIQVVRVREIAQREHRVGLVDRHQPCGVAVGQGLDQRRVHESEDRQAGAHAQSQHEDGGAGESGILAATAGGRSRGPSAGCRSGSIPAYRGTPLCVVPGPRSRAARRGARRPGSCRRRCTPQSAAPGDIAVPRRVPAPRRRARRANESAGGRYRQRAFTTSPPTISEMAPDRRSHCAASCSSALRPALVSV